MPLVGPGKRIQKQNTEKGRGWKQRIRRRATGRKRKGKEKEERERPIWSRQEDEARTCNQNYFAREIGLELLRNSLRLGSTTTASTTHSINLRNVNETGKKLTMTNAFDWLLLAIPDDAKRKLSQFLFSLVVSIGLDVDSSQSSSCLPFSLSLFSLFDFCRSFRSASFLPFPSETLKYSLFRFFLSFCFFLSFSWAWAMLMLLWVSFQTRKSTCL